MNKMIIPLVVVVIIVALAVAYGLGTNQGGRGPAASPTPIVSTISETPAPTSEPSITPQKINSKSMVTENIQAAVQTKNYQAFEGYMANEVSVILYATECCGILSAQKATEQMSYLNGGTPPWDFSGTSETAQKLINADPANFKDRLIGIASNGMVVSFNLNNANKIDKIFISADYKLITP